MAINTNINSDTALMRGVRTALQAGMGLVVGLATTIWAVPGVPDAVVSYLKDNLLPLVLSIGGLSGVAGFVWNLLRRGVKNV